MRYSAGMNTPTLRACTETLTVYAIDEHGEHHDLNADGEPCLDVADLRCFIWELYRLCDACDATERDALLASLPRTCAHCGQSNPEPRHGDYCAALA